MIELHQLVAVRIDPGPVMRGLDQAERERIASHAEAADFPRQRFHQSDRSGARGRDDGKS